MIEQTKAQRESPEFIKGIATKKYKILQRREI